MQYKKREERKNGRSDKMLNVCIPDGYNVFTWETYDYSKIRGAQLVKRPRGNQGGRNKETYKDLICAFDIETSLVPYTDQSLMYIWQCAIEDDIIIGRTWEDYKKFIEGVTAALNDVKLVFYVHNLSYEFQFLSGIFNFNIEDVFSIKKRKVLKCTYECIEYRCSYLLTNSNLESFTKDMKVEHIKKPGEDIDYTKYRTSTTFLNEKELAYCLNDVLGLVEALHAKMNHDLDTLYTIPLTSTGYVRRDTKNCMRILPHNYVKKLIPDYEIYTILRESFRGGNTHANRFYANTRLKNVYSYDRVSSYPDVQLNCMYPVTSFIEVRNTEFNNILYLLEHDKALIMRCKMKNIRLIDKWEGFPYIPKDKCRNIVNGKYDNGRILSADYLEISITDIDLKIILDQYSADMHIYNCYMASYGELPKTYKRNIARYFEKKTLLKGDESMFYEYCLSKAKLNAIFGMTAQCPVKQNIIFSNGEFIEEDRDLREIYIDYKKKAFLPYQWGVWCTAWARYRLHEGLKIAGNDAVYIDTDSIKSLRELDLTEYNELRKNDSIKNGAIAKDKNGRIHYMGLFEFECKYDVFKTLGAKKYVYQFGDKITHVTIAGVSKKLGGIELDSVLKRKLKGIAHINKKYNIRCTKKHFPKDGIDFFRNGFVFRKAGGNAAIYNDKPDCAVWINGENVKITRNTAIVPSEYTLGTTDEYAALLALCEKERLKDLWK